MQNIPNGRYELCDVEFLPGGRTYSYLAEVGCYSVGNLVVVCAGRDNHEVTVRITAKRPFEEANVSVPTADLKRILRLANEEERGQFAKPHKPKAQKAKKQPGKASKRDVAADPPYIADGLQPDGSLIISYSDYNVEIYGGEDIEVVYELSPSDTAKLHAYLAQKYTGSIESMLLEECGSNYLKKGPTELFEEAGVKYERFVWIS